MDVRAIADLSDQVWSYFKTNRNSNKKGGTTKGYNLILCLSFKLKYTLYDKSAVMQSACLFFLLVAADCSCNVITICNVGLVRSYCSVVLLFMFSITTGNVVLVSCIVFSCILLQLAMLYHPVLFFFVPCNYV